MTKRTEQQQAVLELLLDEYPAAKDLPKRQQQALADVYAAEGAAGVDRVLIESLGGEKGGPPLSNQMLDGYNQALPHFAWKKNGRLVCVCESNRCPQFKWMVSTPEGAAWMKKTGTGPL